MVQDIGFQARHKSCVILRNNWNKKKHRVSTSQKLNKNNSFKKRNSFQTHKHNITSLRNKRLFLFSPLLSRLASTHLCNSSQLVFALPQKTKEAGGKKKKEKNRQNNTLIGNPSRIAINSPFTRGSSKNRAARSPSGNYFENSFKARAVEEKRRNEGCCGSCAYTPISRTSPSPRGNEEKVKNKSDKATAAGSSFPRTQPLAFGLLSRFFRGLRTASSQERLTLLASQIPSRRIPPPSLVRHFSPLSLSPIPPLSSFSFSPPSFLRHVVVIVDVTISRPLFAPPSLSFSFSLPLRALERSKGDGIIDTEEKRDGER